MPKSLPIRPFREGTLQDLRPRVLDLALYTIAATGLLVFMVAEGSHWPADVATLGLLLVFYSIILGLITQRRHVLGHWLLVLGLLAAPSLASRWLGSAGPLSLLVLPAALATILFGGWHGCGAALAASCILYLGRGTSDRQAGLEITFLLVSIWSVQILTWATVRFTIEVVERSEAGYREMRGMLENAREGRLQWKQTREDLMLANAELARLSERLEAMRQVAEEARRAEEEFVANVSHELRTPLNMIIGFSEMITRLPHAYKGRIPAELVADVSIIQRNSEHLSELVDDVLDISRVHAGRMALTKDWVCLNEVVESAVTAVSPLFESKGLYLKQELPADLPSVLCDRTRVRQVILNLLSNAGRYSTEGGAIVRASQEGSTVVVSVADTGPGITPEDQKRIFEPFVQVTADAGMLKSSSGLGLTISRRFVEMHGGRMWLESEAGKGTKFYFSLPVEERRVPGPPALSRWFSPYHVYEPRDRPSLAPAPHLTLRFIVVEAEDTLSLLMRRYQREAEIVAVRTIEEALREAIRLPVHAIMVNSSTADALWSELKRFSSLPDGIPVFGCSLPGREEAAKQLGVARYLLKPIRAEELLSALDSLRRPISSVLLVDDEADALQLFGRMLSSARPGCRILRAFRGDQALDLLRERQPDVVFLDLFMPGMDGYAVLRDKSLDPRISAIPVVAISARDPVRAPITSTHLTVLKGGNLPSQDLLRSIAALTEILAPPDRLIRQGPPEKLRA